MSNHVKLNLDLKAPVVPAKALDALPGKAAGDSDAPVADAQTAPGDAALMALSGVLPFPLLAASCGPHSVDRLQPDADCRTVRTGR